MNSVDVRRPCATRGVVRAAALTLAWLIAATPLTAEPLPLSVAMARAAQADPARLATQQRLAAAAGAIRQADTRPNPSLGFELENGLGSGAYSGIDRLETTLSYQQPIERGGKRHARVGVAMAQKDLIVAQGRAKAWDIMAQAQTLWIEAVVAEAQVALAQDRLTLARQAQSEISRRVNAARDPLFAGSLADADVASAEIALDQSRARALQLKMELAAFWGGTADFELDPAWLENLDAATTQPTLMETPDIELLRAQQRVASAQITVETSRSIQDPTVQAGLRHFKADGAVALVVGGSIPLGRYNRNQGAIDSAQSTALAAASDIEAADRARLRQIAASTQKLINYAVEVRRIDSEVIPKAELAVVQVREGFARGGFTYRDVIGAQDMLMQARTRRLDILKAFQLERAGRERLAGQWVPLIPGAEAGQ